MRYEAVVIGVSAGGMDAMKIILPMLEASFPLPIVIVQHRNRQSDGFLSEYLDSICALAVKEAEEKEPLCPGTIYLAPAGYHLLVEPDKTFSLSVDERVNHSCPSIDVLFESAADTYGAALIGIILTGANSDGAQGLKTIKAHGGLAIVQNPETAESRSMPQAALAAIKADHIVTLKEIIPLLTQLGMKEKAYGTGS